MKKLIAIFAAMAATAVLSASAADGKALYEKDCAKCHGADGKGQTVMGKKMQARDYTDAKVQDSMKDEEMAKAIKEGVKKDGKTVMKPSANLSDDEVKAIVAHMRSFKK